MSNSDPHRDPGADPAAEWDRPTSDPVEHPGHYTAHPSGVECITVTEHMNFCRGNAVKYLWRAGQKGGELEDLRKARWYIDREIARLEGQSMARQNAEKPAPRSWPRLDQVPHDVVVEDRNGTRFEWIHAAWRCPNHDTSPASWSVPFVGGCEILAPFTEVSA